MRFVFTQEELAAMAKEIKEAAKNDEQHALVIGPDNIMFECEYCKWNVEGVCINTMSAGFDIEPDHFCSRSEKRED